MQIKYKIEVINILRQLTDPKKRGRTQASPPQSVQTAKSLRYDHQRQKSHFGKSQSEILGHHISSPEI